jgi:anti-anti-sigma factor
MQKYQFTLDSQTRALTIKINDSRLEASNVGELKEKLTNIWTNEIDTVTVDCTNVDFLDSSGIGTLISIQKRLKMGGAPLCLSNVQPGVRSMIELLHLHRIFALKNN